MRSVRDQFRIWSASMNSNTSHFVDSAIAPSGFRRGPLMYAAIAARKSARFASSRNATMARSGSMLTTVNPASRSFSATLSTGALPGTGMRNTKCGGKPGVGEIRFRAASNSVTLSSIWFPKTGRPPRSGRGPGGKGGRFRRSGFASTRKRGK